MGNSYYHVSRNGELSALAKLVCDFEQLEWPSKGALFSKERYIETLSQNYEAGLSSWGQKNTLIPYLSGYDSNRIRMVDADRVTETFFELIRKFKFPHMPSRFQSMFACGSLDEAISFRNKYSKCPDCPIYLVESDHAVKLDMTFIRLGNYALMAERYAEQYWQGASSLNPVWEVLLQYPIRIIERVS